MTRNLVLCLDGTNNEPEHGCTNVARIYTIAKKDDNQLVYYDPGVGTMGARGAVTQLGQALTRGAGLVAGFGIKDNIEEAYTWLSRHYQPGDRIYVFGFSRGAYTARALTGMLRTIGLLRPGTENLVPYAVKLYSQSGNAPAKPGTEPDVKTKAADEAFWAVRREFRKQFGQPDFPNPFDKGRQQVRFLGVWDTVKSVGWLNLKARWEMAHWPFTRKIENVEIARHALALDERRRPYQEYRFGENVAGAADGRHREMWFAGVHSDVGGQFPDNHDLSDIALSWMVKEAAAAGLLVDEGRYKSLLGANYADDLPAELAMGKIHDSGRMWWLAGGWRARPVLPGDALHPSVLHRIDASAKDGKPYRQDLSAAARQSRVVDHS
jgi:uncharacterized protein (DUF2235 family)